MTQTLIKTIADFSTTLTTKTAVGATTGTLTTGVDSDSVQLPTGTYAFTIDRNNSQKEHFVATLTGAALTSIETVTRGTGLGTSGLLRTHRKGAEVVISDHAAIKRMMNILDGTTNLDASTPLTYDGTMTPSGANEISTKSYVDATATGTTTIDRVLATGDGGEVVAAGELVYLKVSDGEWYLADADTAAEVDNVMLGIAQGAGTDGGAISGGILISGIDSNQTGLTDNTAYYASNTPGGVSSTPGTTEVSVGVSRSTTSILFDPRYSQQLTENEQDALVGNNTDIAVGTGNLFVTQTGLQDGAEVYAADAEASDTYVVTLSPVPAALETGMVIHFKANTVNTGACTINVNSLGAKSIKKLYNQDPADGDIAASQLVTLIYDGTNFQMQSQVGKSSFPDIKTYTADDTWTKPGGAQTVEVYVWGAGGGGGSGERESSVVGGGGGGGGGGFSYKSFAASSLAATETITVGAGGTGGAAISTLSDGNIGTVGGNSSFSSAGTIVSANGGGAGGPGTNGNAAGGTGGASSPSATDVILEFGQVGGAGGTGGSGAENGNAGTGHTALPAAGGGAGGGGGSNATNQTGGAAGSNVHTTFHAVFGFPDKYLSATTSPMAHMLTSVGGAGSAGVGSGGGTPVAGTDGTAPSGGGGGGGAKDSDDGSQSSGAGGAGAAGKIMVITTF